MTFKKNVGHPLRTPEQRFQRIEAMKSEHPIPRLRAGNPACPDAVTCLRQHFQNEESSAPVRAAAFILGPFALEESADIRFQRRQIQQDMVNAGRLLRAALPGT